MGKHTVFTVGRLSDIDLLISARSAEWTRVDEWQCWRHLRHYRHISNFDRKTYRSTIYCSNFTIGPRICCYLFVLCSLHPGKYVVSFKCSTLYSVHCAVHSETQIRSWSSIFTIKKWKFCYVFAEKKFMIIVFKQKLFIIHKCPHHLLLTYLVWKINE